MKKYMRGIGVLLGMAVLCCAAFAADLTVTGDLFVTGPKQVVGGASHVPPYWGFDLQGNHAVFVRQPNNTSANVPYSGFVFSSNQSGLDHNVAQLMFANEVLVGLEKRVAQILVKTHGSTSSGKFIFRTFDNGVGVDALTIYRSGVADFKSDISALGNITAGGNVSADVIEVRGADVAELFDVTGDADEAVPGMVLCIDPDKPGGLMPSRSPYDKRVAGVISGAGGLRAGIVLGQEGTLAFGNHPVALNGRVYCFVDASQNAVEPGDLLTTSDVPGHAMKVTDHARAMGSIIGKAMTPLAMGKTGLVLVLVSIQ